VHAITTERSRRYKEHKETEEISAWAAEFQKMLPA
jgi:hypothetical protein